MFAETISLGILALPHATARLGFAPGLAFIALFGLVATYAGYVIGQFKLRHPEVCNPADAGNFPPFTNAPNYLGVEDKGESG